MEVKVTLHLLTIKDKDTDEEFTIKTIRSAKDIAEYLEESEKDEMVTKLEQTVWEVINQGN
jgi:hypothetical protein